MQMTADAQTEQDPTDPFARVGQTFPQLNEEMTGRVAGYGGEENIEAGTLLFERGQRGVDFFLVLSGSIEIFDTDARGVPNVFAVHRQRNFTGEMDLFNDRQILVSGMAGADTRVVRVKRAAFRRLVIGESDIGEIIMRAFILRRVGFIRHTMGGVTLAGPAHNGDMLRLQTFMTRNAYPHRVLDTERDADSEGFLRCFDIKADELPVVILPGEVALRNPSTVALADALGLTETLDAKEVYDVAVVGAGPAGLAAAVYAASEDCPPLCSKARRPAGRPAPHRRLKTTWAFPPVFPGRHSPGAPRHRRRNSAPGWPLPAW